MSESLIDSHCHIDLPAFDPDRDAVIQRCHDLGVKQIVIPGVYREQWPKELQLPEHYSGLYPALGLHPCYLKHHQPQHLQDLEAHLSRGEAIAVGEIGLDFFIDDPDEDAQMEYFNEQLALAKQYDLPVLLHVRKAHDQVLKRLRQLKLPRAGFVHAFSGSEQQGYQYLDLGFKLGFGGAVTYDRAKKLRRIIKGLPEEGFVLETDAPDIPPAFQEGPRNTPEYLPRILEVIAELRQQPVADLAQRTTQTVKQVLGID